jgi:hypothetical protein
MDGVLEWQYGCHRGRANAEIEGADSTGREYLVVGHVVGEVGRWNTVAKLVISWGCIQIGTA